MTYANVLIIIDDHPMRLSLPIGDDPANTNANIRRYVRNITRNMLTLAMRTHAIVHIIYPNYSEDHLIIRENNTETL